MKVIVLTLVALAALTTLTVLHFQGKVTDPEPPVWPSAFEESFDEIFTVDNKTEIVNGMLYYDATNNRSRLDRASGAFDSFCGSLQPNVTTPCINLVNGGQRYIIFPNKKQCCICCDAAHGCGILKPDWLSGAEYLGEESFDGKPFEKWSKDGTILTI